MFSTWWHKFVRPSVKASSRKRRPTERRRMHAFTPTLEGLEDRRLLAAGSLDPTFNLTGLLSTDFNTGLNMQATSVAVQTDNKIVVVGYTFDTAAPSFQSEFVVARLNPDGTPDATFGNQGVVLTPFGVNTSDQAFSVAIQPGGKIVVAGSSGIAGNAGTNDFAVARYNTDGSLDATFANQGLLTIDYQAFDDRASAVAIQTDGKIVVGGTANAPAPFNDRDFALARINPDGSQDSDFDADGKVQFDYATLLTGGTLVSSFDDLNALTIQPNGQIVVAGASDLSADAKLIFHDTPNSDPSNFALARINALDGTLDTTFGQAGLRLTDFFAIGTRSNVAASTDIARSVAIQTDGKIVVAGPTNFGGGGNNFGLAVYATNGSVDNTFNTDGIVSTDFATDFTLGIQDQASAIAIRRNGNFVLAGSTTRLGGPNFGLASYNKNGTLDLLFDPPPPPPLSSPHGQVVTSFAAGSVDQANNMLIQADGKILAVGSSTVGGTTRFALARYQGTDDALPTVSINDRTVIEENSGTKTVTFTVSLSTASDQTVSVDFVTSDGTASSPTDYVPTLGSLVFSPGETTKTVDVTVNGDTAQELDETFFVNLVNLSSTASFANNRGTGTIIDDDTVGVMQLSAGAYTVSESGGVATITVTRTGSTTGTASVDFTTSDGSAIDGADYNLTQGTITFGNGENSKTFSIPIADDPANEINETINLTLSMPAPLGAKLGDQQTAVLTILDNDPIPNVTVEDVSQLEQNAGVSVMEFIVALSAASGQTVTLDYLTADGSATAGTDYQAANGTLVFNPGETTKTVRVSIVGDAVGETDETFTLTLSNVSPTGFLLDNQATGTIEDDDGGAGGGVGGAFQFSAATFTTGESAGTVTITVTRMGNTTGAATVDFATSDGTATPADYTPISGTLSFADGEGSKTFSFAINDDALNETDETVNLGLTRPFNGTLGTSNTTAVLTIQDNDPLPTMVIGNATVVEGNVGSVVAEFEVSLSAPSGLLISVDYATSNGVAKSPVDYLHATGTLIFNPGETTQLVRVTVNGDTTAPEPDEDFFVDLSNISPTAILADSQGTGLILDDDSVGGILLPTLTINDVSLAEGNSGTTDAVFTVTLSAASTSIVTIDFTTDNGTATASVPPITSDDYVGTTGTLVFNPGETSQTVRVTINGDGVRENDETFLVKLSNPSAANITKSQGVGTILDDDGAPPGVPPPTVPLTPEQAFVSQVYRDILNREVDAAGLDYWVDILGEGASRTQVVLGIQATPEYRDVVVQGLFNQYLHRNVDAQGLSGFTTALLNGATIEEVTAVIISSPEYFEMRGGGTNEGYVAALFEDALGRTIDAAGQAFFGQAFANGASRFDVATSVLNSTEHRQLLVESYYMNFLGRSADAGGMAFWVSALEQGTRDEQVIAGIIGSSEYLTRATS